MSNEVNVNPTVSMIELMRDVVKFSNTSEFSLSYKDAVQAFSIHGNENGEISFTVPANTIASDEVVFLDADRYYGLRKLLKFMLLTSLKVDGGVMAWLRSKDPVDLQKDQAIVNRLATAPAYMRYGSGWMNVRTAKVGDYTAALEDSQAIFFETQWNTHSYNELLVKHTSILNRASRAHQMQTHELYKALTNASGKEEDRFGKVFSNGGKEEDRFGKVFSNGLSDAVSLTVGPYGLLAYVEEEKDGLKRICFHVTHSGQVINVFYGFSKRSSVYAE